MKRINKSIPAPTPKSTYQQADIYTIPRPAKPVEVVINRAQIYLGRKSDLPRRLKLADFLHEDMLVLHYGQRGKKIYPGGK